MRIAGARTFKNEALYVAWLQSAENDEERDAAIEVVDYLLNEPFGPFGVKQGGQVVAVYRSRAGAEREARRMRGEEA